jgi:Flp pilus assembly protein TadD
MHRAGVESRIAVATFLIFFVGAVSTRAAALDDQLCDLRADFALGSEDYPTAIALHRKLLQSHPDNALAHYHLGFAFGMTGRGGEEVNEYLTAARLGLRNWDLFLNLGLAYLGQNQLSRAADALVTAVSLGRAHAETHFNLAIIYERENRLDEALREITAARRLAPDDPDVANMSAIIRVESGDPAGAREIWAGLVQVAPDYQPASANRSSLNRHFQVR